MTWAVPVRWTRTPPETLDFPLGIPRPPRPLGPPAGTQLRRIHWTPDGEPRFGGGSVMEQAMSAVEGLREMQLVQRRMWNALLGVDRHAQWAMHFLLQAHTPAISDADPRAQEQIRQLRLEQASLMNIRRSASHALRDQEATILATEFTQTNLKDCAAHVVCTCAKQFMNRLGKR